MCVCIVLVYTVYIYPYSKKWNSDWGKGSPSQTSMFFPRPSVMCCAARPMSLETSTSEPPCGQEIWFWRYSSNILFEA